MDSFSIYMSENFLLSFLRCTFSGCRTVCFRFFFSFSTLKIFNTLFSHLHCFQWEIWCYFCICSREVSFLFPSACFQELPFSRVLRNSVTVHLGIVFFILCSDFVKIFGSLRLQFASFWKCFAFFKKNFCLSFLSYMSPGNFLKTVMLGKDRVHLIGFLSLRSDIQCLKFTILHIFCLVLLFYAVR